MSHVAHIIGAVGSITRIFALLLLVPAFIALAYEPWDFRVFPGLRVPRNSLVFGVTSAMAGILWFGVSWFNRGREKGGLQEREAYVSVGIGWLFLVLLAMIPFKLSGMLPAIEDAFFEAMSGLTATGATVLTGVYEDVPKSLMFWRALLQYLGGMGIIVLSVALLSRLTHGGSLLVAAEITGPTMQRIRPRLAETAKTLWKIYAILSGVCMLAYFVAMKFHSGLGWGDAAFDAVLHTFTTLSTAGFSNHSASLGFYDSWIVEAIAIVFVLVAGTNFALHYFWMKGDWRRLWNDPEWRFFIGLWAFSTLAATGLIWRAGTGIVEAFRGAAFTVASIGTSLGYVTVDYDQWPDGARFILILLMFTGASAGSTSGGIKVLRVLLLMKMLQRQLQKLLHPRAVIPVRIGRKVIPEDALMNVTAFFFAFLTIWLVGAGLIITVDPALDLFDGAVAAASAMGNTGPAMGVVGPTETFAPLHPVSKVALGLMMWFGRLELFAALLVFSPGSWKN